MVVASRELVLGDLILARNDPALATLRDAGLFDDLAAHHARLHGEVVQGAITAGWIGPHTVRICYHVHDPASGPLTGVPQITRTSTS